MAVFPSLLFLLSVVVFESFAKTPLKPPKEIIDERNNNAIKADDVNYRLPDTIVPSNYKIDLKLTEDDLKNQKFTGTVAITFELKTGVTSASEIKLHAKDITITKTTLKGKDATETIDNPPIDTTTDILTITPKTTALTGGVTYVLTIEYTGILSSTSMHGFYRSEYTENGEAKYLATTQFESTYARQAFPCFDEPAFKATFDISITYPTGYTALSNRPQKAAPTTVDDTLKKIEFETTPKMSTYLVAFIVSQFDCTTATNVDSTIPTRVCSRNGLDSARKWAQTIVPKAIVSMEGITGIKYSVGGIGKMDAIAIPDFEAGAMENWGLVTYREADLLYDPTESSNYYKQSVATTIQHEFAHQWFGDLVTLKWWKEVFLNEGFARLYEYHATAKIDDLSDFELEKQFIVEQLQTAFEIDDTASSKALSYDVQTPDEISERFDHISYNKGGSVLRMVEHSLTEEKFQAGLNKYLTKFDHANTEATDLWSSLNEQATGKLPTGVDLNTVMDSWTYKPGFPVITVTADGDNVKITQKRFMRAGTDNDNTEWYVPISYYTSADKTIDTLPKQWLEPKKELIINNALSNVDWIIFNTKQSGYYRVDYDETLWSKISTQLKTDVTKIDELNRAQIVNDLFNFGRAGMKDHSTIFEFVKFLETDNSYYPWYSAFHAFSLLLQSINDDDVRSNLNNYIIDLMPKLLKSVSFDIKANDQIYSLKQALALDWACQLNQEDCVTKAKEQFSTYVSKGTKPSPNLRSVVYCHGLFNSGDIKSDWDFLWKEYQAATLSTEQVTILKALACTKDTETLKQYLQYGIVDDSAIRLQDLSSYTFKPVYSKTKEGLETTIQFMVDNYAAIVKRFGSTRELKSIIKSLTDYIRNDDQLNKLKELSSKDGVSDDVKTAIETAAKKVATNQEFQQKLESQLKTYFDSGASLNSLSIVLLFVIVLNLII